MFAIEDVPLPSDIGGPSPKGGGRRPRYPFLEMKPGQSFLVPERRAHAAATAASYFKARTPGWDYTTRREPSGVRIYRIDGMANHPPRLP